MGTRVLVSAFALMVIAQAPRAQAIQQVSWCTRADADGTVIDAYIYQESCIKLCVELPADPSPPPPFPSPPLPDIDTEAIDRARRHLLQSTADVTLSLRKTGIDESYPDPAVNAAAIFNFPYDEVNYPPSGYFTGSPAALTANMDYCFALNEFEECAYTVCFNGVSTDPTNFSSSDVRCFRINVWNDVLTFDGDDSAEDLDVSSKLTPADGLTFSAYVYPACTESSGFNQTVLYFGSERDFPHEATTSTDTGYEIRNGIKWSVAGPEDGKGQFFYYDCNIGVVATPAQYACDVWHYVAVTIAGSTGTLYVDGVAPGHTLPSSRDMYTFSVNTFNTTTRPDNNVDNMGAGVFKMGHYPGEGFVGSLDEVRVYNYAMSSSEVFEDMVTRTRCTKTRTQYQSTCHDMAGLKLYLTMTPLDEGVVDDEHTPTSAGASIPQRNQIAIPSMTPCVLGLEHSVGPVDGMCSTKVYGWSFSDSTNSQCSIAGVQGRAVWNSYIEVTCSTPGHLSPRFATVLASNNGLNFTDTSYVDKTVRHLYMESSLYVQGTNGGASADQLCKDFTADSQAVTVSAWSCPKCTPSAAAEEYVVDLASPSQETC